MRPSRVFEAMLRGMLAARANQDRNWSATLRAAPDVVHAFRLELTDRMADGAPEYVASTGLDGGLFYGPVRIHPDDTIPLGTAVLRGEGVEVTIRSIS